MGYDNDREEKEVISDKDWRRKQNDRKFSNTTKCRSCGKVIGQSQSKKNGGQCGQCLKDSW
jgi:hypothetical protein